MSLQDITYGEGSEPSKDHWLNPIAMATLQAAVGRRDERVTLNNVEYALTYDHLIGRNKTVCIHISRTDGQYAPRGYISVKRIEQFSFED